MCSACLQGDSLLVIVETERGGGKKEKKKKKKKSIATAIHPLSQADSKGEMDTRVVALILWMKSF